MSNQQSATGKPWANPTPAGLVALAVACAGFFALLTGLVDHSAMPLLGCWLIGGFVIQIVVALLDLKSGSTAGGNTFLFFSAFFMLVSGSEMLIKYFVSASGGALDGRIDGFAWSVLTIVVLLWTPAFMKPFGLLSYVVLLLDVALPIIALADLKLIPAELTQIPAWALLIAGAIAVYLSAAMVVNTTHGRTIYPLPGTGEKAARAPAAAADMPRA